MGRKLYYFVISPPSRFAHQVCQELEIDVDIVNINLATGEQKKPEYLKICPDGVIPAIDDDGFIFNESRAIAAYLCEKYGGNDCSIYPRCPKKRAEVNRMLWKESSVYKEMVTYFGPIVMKGTEPDCMQAKKVGEQLDKMEKHLTTSKFLCGNTWTLADMSFVNGLQNMEYVGFGLCKWPKVKALYDTYKAKCYFKELPPSSEL